MKVLIYTFSESCMYQVIFVLELHQKLKSILRKKFSNFLFVFKNKTHNKTVYTSIMYLNGISLYRSGLISTK